MILQCILISIVYQYLLNVISSLVQNDFKRPIFNLCLSIFLTVLYLFFPVIGAE